jgi:hypothetical protein
VSIFLGELQAQLVIVHDLSIRWGSWFAISRQETTCASAIEAQRRNLAKHRVLAMKKTTQGLRMFTFELFASSLLILVGQVQAQVKLGLNTVRGAVPTYQSWVAFTGEEPQVIGDSIDWSTWDSIKYDSPNFLINQWGWYPDKTVFVFALAMFPSSVYGSGQGDFDAGIAGDFDHVYEQVAQTLINNGFGGSTIRLAWEFNGFWMPWHADTPEKQAKFRAYWQRIHNVMMAQGGAGFLWDWNANVSDQTVDATGFYPGDVYVDSIGIDLYDVHGYYYWDKESLTPLQLMRAREIVARLRLTGFQGAQFFRDFARQHNKPFTMSEWGVWDTSLPDGIVGGNDNPHFIRSMYEWIKANDVDQASYFELHYLDGASHSLLDGSHPKASAIFHQLFYQDGFPTGSAQPIIDGNLSEWLPETNLVADPADVGASGVDIRNVYVTHGPKSIYIAYAHEGGAHYQWNWFTFLDTDANRDTGLSDRVGADYLIQDRELYAYTGTNGQWGWSHISSLNVGESNDAVEIEIPRGLIGNPESFEFSFYADNSIHNTNGDVVPEYGISPGFLLYDLNPSHNIPKIDGAVSEWPAATQVVSDPDDVSGGVAHVDIRSMSMNHTSNHVYVGFQHDGGAPLDDAWLLFLDTDLNTSTGYAVFSMGAEYLVQNRLLFRYVGSGNDWNWQVIENITASDAGGNVEMVISRAAIGDPEAFRYLFYGDNLTFHPGSSWFDLAPDDAWFATPTYRLSPQVDGNLLDWLAVDIVGSDIEDSVSSLSDVEMRDLYMTSDENRLLLGCRTGNFGFPNAAWQCYFDTDTNANTGFSTRGLGADYRLIGTTLEQYVGGTWQYASSVIVASGGLSAEFGIDLATMGNPSRLDWVFVADNRVNGASLVDYVPDSGHKRYRF